MKHWHVPLCTLVLAFALVSASCSADQYRRVTVTGEVDVIIIAGQSNAVGLTGYTGGGSTHNVAAIFNPEYPPGFVEFILGYSHHLGGHSPDHFSVEIPISEKLERPTVFIKAAWGGTTMIDRWNLRTGDLGHTAYGRILYAMNELIEDGAVPTVRGIIWIQGESDTREPTVSEYYRDDLVELLEHLRGATGSSLAPIIISETLMERSSSVYLEDVRKAQAEAAEELGAVLIQTDDLHTRDGAHLDASSMMTLGRRIAEVLE